MNERTRAQELMLLYDGELPDGEAALVERRAGRDPAALRALADLDAIGDAVRRLERHHAAASDIAGAVMARIEGERAARAAPPARARRAAPLFAAALAMAAALVLVVRDRPVQVAPAARLAPPAARPAHEPVRAHAVQAAIAAPAVAEPDEGSPSVAIESVDFGARDGTIFMVQNGESETPVVWLVDETAGPGGRMAPL